MLDTFFESLDINIATWKSVKTPHEQLYSLSTSLNKTCEHLIELGDDSARALSPMPSSKLLDYRQSFLLHYRWMEAAKSFLILWRDTIFEYLKGHILYSDGTLTTDDWQQWQTDAQNSLHTAARELKDFMPLLIAEQQKISRGALHVLNQWKHQDLPWPVYKEQIQAVQQQSEDLSQWYNLLQNSGHSIATTRSIISDIRQRGVDEISTYRQLANEAIGTINTHFKDSRGKIPLLLEQLEKSINQPALNKVFNAKLEEALQQLPKDTQDVPVAIQHSHLQLKEINFSKSISRWLESEVLPILYEVWELTTNIENNLKMAFVNIRNRAILLNQENTAETETLLSKAELSQPLLTFLQQTASVENELMTLHELINKRISTSFKLSNIFLEEEDFLSIPLQSTINHFRSNQSRIKGTVKEWWKKQQHTVQKWLSSVQEEDSLSTAEKAVRYIEERSPNTENQAYTSIFLTKGYIGESFWVGRAAELKRIDTLIEQWRLGYRGAVMLNGHRFSGKSLFGDLIATKYFPQQTIRLTPNTSINVHGRTFHTSYKLEEALNFISKHSLTDAPLIWIDDLELWQDPTTSISHNTMVLNKHIERYANRLFYIVSCSNGLKKQLESTHNFSKCFQATISLDTMNQDEVKRAILIRHGATHKELANTAGEALAPHLFEKHVAKIYRIARGNIGEALNLWAYTTHSIDKDRVHQDASKMSTLPNIINTNTGVLLRTLVMEKRSNEYRLRKRLGPAFNTKYAQPLARLLSTKLVVRQLDGWITINDAAVNDIINQLDHLEYLN